MSCDKKPVQFGCGQRSNASVLLVTHLDHRTLLNTFTERLENLFRTRKLHTMSVSANAKAKRMRTYEAPSSPVAYFFWRKKMWAETTFALSMMEPWERFIICASDSCLLHSHETGVHDYGANTGTITFLFTILFLTGLIKYLPTHLRFVQRRTSYYLFGRESDAGDLISWAWTNGVEATSGVRRSVSQLLTKSEL